MNGLQKQLSSASSSLPRERAKPPQIDAFKAAIEQVRVALEDDCAALISSSVLKTLFHSSIGAAIHFNRSDARLENDPEQGALFESIATIEEVVKTPSEEAALLKAGVVKAVPHLLSVLLSTEDDVECREAAVSCLIELMRQKTIKKALQKTDFSDGEQRLPPTCPRTKPPRLTPLRLGQKPSTPPTVPPYGRRGFGRGAASGSSRGKSGG